MFYISLFDDIDSAMLSLLICFLCPEHIQTFDTKLLVCLYLIYHIPKPCSTYKHFTQVQAVVTMHTQPTQCVINVRPNVRTVQCSTVVILVLSSFILSILISNVAARLAVGLRLTILTALLQ